MGGRCSGATGAAFASWRNSSPVCPVPRPVSVVLLLCETARCVVFSKSWYCNDTSTRAISAASGRLCHKDTSTLQIGDRQCRMPNLRGRAFHSAYLARVPFVCPSDLLHRQKDHNIRASSIKPSPVDSRVCGVPVLFFLE